MTTTTTFTTFIQTAPVAGTLVGTEQIPIIQNSVTKFVNPATLAPTVTKVTVGLGNVDNTSDATKNAATATLTNKTINAPIVTGGMTVSGSASFANNTSFNAPVYVNGTLSFTTPLAQNAAPVIASGSGFGTGASIGAYNGSFAFLVFVGSSPSNGGSITMPFTAANKWICFVSNLTNPAGSLPTCTTSSTSSVSISNYARNTGSLINFTSGDVLQFMCCAV